MLHFIEYGKASTVHPHADGKASTVHPHADGKPSTVHLENRLAIIMWMHPPALNLSADMGALAVYLGCCQKR